VTLTPTQRAVGRHALSLGDEESERHSDNHYQRKEAYMEQLFKLMLMHVSRG
jgi:hypothetical protein